MTQPKPDGSTGQALEGAMTAPFPISSALVVPRLDRKHATVRDLRRENRAAVLWSLYFSRPRSRQDLSAATGLSPASVTNVVRELLDEGIVIEAGSVDSDGGRPRVMLDMNPEHGYVIGVDIGETRGRGELVDLTMGDGANADYP